MLANFRLELGHFETSKTDILIFLSNKRPQAGTIHVTFLIYLKNSYGQKMKEIDSSTLATKSIFSSIFPDRHSLRDCYGIQHSEQVLILQESRLRSQGLYNTLLCIYAWLPQVRKWSGKKILQRREKVREFHFQSRKNKMFETSQEKVNFSQFILLPLLLLFSNIKILLYILQT